MNDYGGGLDPEPTEENSSYAINVDSKSALLAVANKHSTHPPAVDTRRKTTELMTTTPITFHWIKGHTVLKGNERADYLAKTVASYNPIIKYEQYRCLEGSSYWRIITQNSGIQHI